MLCPLVVDLPGSSMLCPLVVDLLHQLPPQPARLLHVVPVGGRPPSKLVSPVLCITSTSTCRVLSSFDLGVEALLEGAEEISEEVGVGVLAQLVQHEPVAQVAVAEHLSTGCQVGVGESSGPSKKEHRPERWDGDTGEPEHQVHPGEDGQAEEPEPQEQKHLFVYNVEGEN